MRLFRDRNDRALFGTLFAGGGVAALAVALTIATDPFFADL
jgi:hypothetical protein